MQWCEEPGWLDLPPRAATQCVGGATTAKTQVSQNYETFNIRITTNTNKYNIQIQIHTAKTQVTQNYETFNMTITTNTNKRRPTSLGRHRSGKITKPST